MIVVHIVPILGGNNFPHLVKTPLIGSVLSFQNGENYEVNKCSMRVRIPTWLITSVFGYN